MAIGDGFDSRKTPYWENKCEHFPDTYMGSINFPTVYDKKHITVKYDIYIYEDKSENCQHICIRYGKEVNEYMSVGNISQFIRASEMNSDYRKVLDFLRSKGKFCFEKNKNG